MIDGKLKLRLLNDSEDDYKMLEKWYQEEEIYSHFEQKKLNYKEIKDKYFPRTLKDAKIPVYMIEYDKMPIGIIQYQLIGYKNKELYNINCNNCYEKINLNIPDDVKIRAVDYELNPTSWTVYK